MFALVIFFIPIRRNNYFLEVVEKAGKQFRNAGWVVLPLFLITGFFNLIYRGFDFSFSSKYHLVVWMKIFFFVVILSISAIHDFIILSLIHI